MLQIAGLVVVVRRLPNMKPHTHTHKLCKVELALIHTAALLTFMGQIQPQRRVKHKTPERVTPPWVPQGRAVDWACAFI